MICQLKETGITRQEFREVKCDVCDRKLFTIESIDALKIPCGKDKPSQTRRAVNFGKAIIKHVAGGMKRVTPEQIRARLEICKECPLFRPTSSDGSEGWCSHQNCGCGISGNSEKFLNKLAFASEACPLGKWGAIQDGQQT